MSAAGGAVWEPLGPFGGPAEYVVTSPSTPQLVLAGSPNSLLFRSRDGGAAWQHLAFPAELASSLHVILPHPTDERQWLAGVSPDSGGSGLFFSRDGGDSWEPRPFFAGKAVWAIAHFPGDPRVMVLGASDGIYRSNDGGGMWQRISPLQDENLKPVVSVAFDPAKPEVIYAGTPHLPWKTSDGGTRWQSIHTGMSDDSDVFSIHVDRDDPERVYASACSGIYRSLSAGRLWAKLRGAADASFRTYIISRDPHEKQHVWAGTTHGLMLSVDGGTIWRTVARHSVKSIAFDPRARGTLYLATRDAGLQKSTDGGKTFQAINRGYANRSFFALAAVRSALWLAGEGTGLMQSADAGKSWAKATVSPAERVLMIAACQGSSTLFAGGAGFLRSAAATATAAPAPWRALSEPRREPVRSVACEGGGATIVAASSRAAYSSADAGRSWTALSAGETAAAGMEWNQIAVSAAPGGTWLAGTSHGLLRSVDQGRSWQRAAAGELATATVASVIAHPGRSGHAFAAQYNQVFLSTDDGRSWRPLTTAGLNRGVVRALAILPEAPNRLFALVAGRGVFVTELE